MKYVVEIGSGAIRYMPNFMKIGSDIQKFKGGKDTNIDTRHGNLISLILFSK
jgi:hypothetical protein